MWIKKIGGKILFRSIIENNFDDSYLDILSSVFCVARKNSDYVAKAFLGNVIILLQAHKAKVLMLDTVTKHIFRIIATIKDYNAVLIDI